VLGDAVEEASDH